MAEKTDWDDFADKLQQLLGPPIEIVQEPREQRSDSVQIAPVVSQQSAVPKSAAPSQQAVPTAKTSTGTAFRVNVSQKTPDGRSVIKSSYRAVSTLDVISFDPFIVQVEESHNAARSEGLFGLLRLKKEAWLEEHLTDASVRKLKSRQTILEEQRRTMEAGERLRRAVLTDDDDVRSQPALPVPQSRPALSAPAPMRPYLTDEQIEGAALRAFLEGATNERRWQPYKEALLHHLPPFAVEEIEDRLVEFWRLNPDGPQFVD